MKSILRLLWLTVILATVLASCNSKPDNPNAPNISIDFTIYPNSLEYQGLNTVGGFMYLTSQLPSYGIIVYRYNLDEFKAYDRLPPNYPHACEDFRLFVEMPFVLDTCSGYKYSILDGSVFEGGDGYPLIQYFTTFDGTALRIHN